MRTPDIEIDRAYMVRLPDHREAGVAHLGLIVKATALATRVTVAEGHIRQRQTGVRMRLDAPVRIRQSREDHVWAEGHEVVVESRHVERPWTDEDDAMLAHRVARYSEQDAIIDLLLALRGPQAAIRDHKVEFGRTEFVEWLRALTGRSS